MSWKTPHHPTDAALDACVTCGLCLPVCPTFRLTGDESASPRGRLTAMSAVAGDAGGQVDQRFAEVMDFCLQCRACETACPSLVPFGEAMEGARAEVVAQVPQRGSTLRRFGTVTVLRSRFLTRLIGVFSAVLDRLGVLRRLPGIGGSAQGLRRLTLPVRMSAGGSWGEPGQPLAVLLSGCVSDVWFSDVHTATVEVLLAAGYRVEAPAAQSCCGALASHGGFAAEAADMAATNIKAFEGADVVVADVAGCGAHLKAYGRFGNRGADVAARTRDINEVIVDAVDAGRLPTFEPTEETIAVQDPCHLEHGQRAHQAVDLVVEAAGYVAAPIDRGGLCCGAAGLYQLDHPETSSELGRRKADVAASAGASTVVSANAGCEMQLRRFLDDAFTVVHPVELYAERLRQTGASPSKRPD